jgi:hypothetical protein
MSLEKENFWQSLRIDIQFIRVCIELIIISNNVLTISGTHEKN